MNFLRLFNCCCCEERCSKSSSSSVGVLYKEEIPANSQKALVCDEVNSSLTMVYSKAMSFKNGPVIDQCFDGVSSNLSEINKVNMFQRAQNREFLGMTEREEAIWKGNYEFICFGDPQIGMGDQAREEDFSRIAVEYINKRKELIKFVIVCGDHTHNLEDYWSKGDLIGGRKKRINELAAYKRIYSKLDESVPLICVCGNHDVGNKPTINTIQLYKEEFGDDYFTF